MKKHGLLLLIFICALTCLAQQKYSAESKESIYPLWEFAVDDSGKILDKPLYRQLSFWGPRLFPSGDPGVASSAMANYVNTFKHNHDRLQKSYIWSTTNPEPIWTEKGPIGKTNQSFGDGRGVGRINRITFDPGYNPPANRTLYASSEAGGIWRSENDGLNWFVCGTDNIEFPTSAIGDIAIDPTNPNIIYVVTGPSDWRHQYTKDAGSHWIRVGENPQFTMGVWKGVMNITTPVQSSSDIVVSWTQVNNAGTNGFLNLFDDLGDGTKVGLGSANKIVVREVGMPSKVEIWVATTKGVARNLDAENNGQWDIIFAGLNGQEDGSLRNIIFKENSNKVFVSGRDIYEFTPNPNPNVPGTWASLTGPGKGLDFTTPSGISPSRINITTIPGSTNVNKLWAYTLDESTNMRYVHKYDGTSWTLLASGHYPTIWVGVTQGRCDIAVNPLDETEIFVTANVVLKIDNSGGFIEVSSYNGSKVHADIHALAMPVHAPNFSFKLCAWHDGRVSRATTHPSNN